MSNYNPAGRCDLQAITGGTGVALPVVYQGAPSAWGVTLASSTTYFFPLGGEIIATTPGETTLLGIHLRWAAAVAGTATIEVCNFPATYSATGQGSPDVSDFDVTAGDWMQWNPAQVGSNYVAVTGTGNSVTAYTVTLGGTNAGGAFFNIADIGAARIRIKLVLTVGGLVRVSSHGKCGD